MTRLVPSKEQTGDSLPCLALFLSCEDTVRRVICKKRKKALTGTQPAGTLILELRKINFCSLSHQVYGIFVIAA